MKRSIATAIIGVSALFLPATLFAQSGGVSDPPPIAETPQAEPAATPPAPAPRAISQQPAPAAPAPVSPSVETAPPTDVPEPTVMPIDDFKELVEAAVEEAPSSRRPWLFAFAGALAAFVLLLGIVQALKWQEKKHTKACRYCKGSGREASAEVCATCAGAGTVEEEHEPTVECKHCGGEGEEPCEKCEGEGRIDGASCDACGGKGVKLDEDGEAVECGVCRGEGEYTATLKRNVPCPDCKGA